MKKSTAVALLVVTTIIGACAPDRGTAPEARKLPGIVRDYNGNCSTEIIADPDCVENGGGDGYEYENYGDMDGSATIHLDLSEDINQVYLIPCFNFAQRGNLARLTDLSPPATIITDGVFNVILNYSVGNSKYRWPTGWWKTTDDSHREVSVSGADAFCYISSQRSVDILFYHFYGVQVRRPANSGSGGDSGGGGGNCETQFITIEVDDGNGWQGWWSGYAQICS